LLTMFCTNSFAQAINVIWDFGDEATMNAVMAYSGTTEAGTVKNNGLTLTIEANGATFRNNGNNIQVRNGAVFKVPVQSTADQVSVSGYPGYSKFSIGNSTEALTGDQTYTAKAIDVKNGYVAVTSLDDNNYYYSISVVQQPKPAPIKLVDEAATATFPFDLGTDGQKATFSTGDADYFVNSKVTYGSNLKILDSYAVGGITETRFQPTAQNDPPTEVEAIRFLIQPKAGFALTPSKVSFTTTRYGTDNGLLDIYWQNPDGTTVELAKGVKPARNSETTPYTNLSYDITGATAGEGGCGLLVYLYHLQNGKQIGFSNIKIEVMPLSAEDYRELTHHGLNGVICFQETYNREHYQLYHPRGMKSRFEWRCDGFDRMGQAGVHSIGMGVLIGLEKEWRTDVTMMAYHLRYLQKHYWRTKYSINFPRMRPAQNEGFQPNCLMSDRELAQATFAMRIFDHDVDISYSTREPSYIRDNMCTLGVTTMSAESKVNPGGYHTYPQALEQFTVSDERTAAEINRRLKELGREPVWKDWDASFDFFGKHAG